jgi:peptidoglycan/LPS O-acetylase OafA/YrhL
MTTSTRGYFSLFDLGTGTFNPLHAPFAYSHRESNPLASDRLRMNEPARTKRAEGRGSLPAFPPALTLELRRPNNFDALRLALATAVIVSHSFALPFGTDWHEPLRAATHGQSLGALAVAGFFVISGYLVTNSWFSSHGFRPYLIKRVLRVYPGYAIAILFGLLILGPVFSGLAYFRTVNAFDLLKAFTVFGETPGQGLPQLPWHDINGSLWTIQYEFACYLALPLVLLVAGTRRWVVVALLILMLPLAAVPGAPQSASFLTRLAFRLHLASGFASYFLAGMAMYLYAPRVTLGRVLACIALLLLGATVPPLLVIVLPLCAAYLVLALALCSPQVGPAFFKRNDLSYGTYLYGWPIGQVVLSALGNRASPWMVMALTLPLTFLVAFGSWTLVERRFLQLKPRGVAVVRATPQAFS